ncbi:translation initiation factor 2 (bIF-2) [Roseivirga pacifica]|uniref:Translation initiation factor IF-2 n=1 Tax=Roseivirga pacifica TaxID=1267423 RepID=A0A1I0N2N2_9BACT|nr:translation initiation factor IF-2 [Roseivirga pacifica]RKQ50886.1 translation initiation factor 2 (bIF-2) [Roseivirga pacifica]SEV95324.1 bacterial translation initiation factor 2 (bIF-2) [Roseivirga pacifica]
MSEEKTMRLSQVARKLNVGRNTIVDFLANKGHEVDSSPNAKISGDQYSMLAKEFAASASEKEEASHLTIGTKHVEDQVIDSSGVSTEPTKSPETPPAKEEPKPEPAPEAPKKEEPKQQPEAEKPAPKKEEPKPVEEKPAEPKPAPKKEEPVAEKPAPEAPKKEEAPKKQEEKKEEPKSGLKVLGKIDLAPKKKPAPAPAKEVKKEAPKKQEEKPAAKKEEKPAIDPSSNKVIEAKADSLRGLKVLGKIELPKAPAKKKPEDKKQGGNTDDKKKRPRKRIQKARVERAGGGNKFGGDNRRGGGNRNDKKRVPKEELTDKEIQEQIKETLARLSGGGKGGGKNRSKYRKEKRSAAAEAAEEQMLKEQQESKILKVTEFISASDLASLMNVSVNEVISACMSLGMFVSINQRLDAEAITIIADEFGYDVSFTSTEEETEVIEEEDNPDDLTDRAPIVTIMGHVDHGKTSLLDYIRDANVTAGEAGGITQHIGAYDVETKDGKRIAFLDTPGHEAFTAMRARGAKITDVAIIVVAADDNVMPQTKEAINHAQVAEVPIVIAINKIDKPAANADKIREELANLNILVEDWGGKYQCQEVSAKTGQGIDELLEKVLLEAELLELKANADKKGLGTVVEASLDKGRGYLATLMVQSGKMKIGDVVLAGPHYGKVKAMFDHRGNRLQEVGPSTPVQMLGLDGAPQAGDRFNVMESEREAREIANKREQILREQSVRTKKHITLDEIGRRLAVGNFKELNVIVKGDVDGSIEALSDSLLKLSTEEVQVNIIHKGVGQISESDVLLASASDAIIIGFQVRPSGGARRIAENEEIEIRLYSIIYDAINEIKDAMEGLLEPTEKEVITGNIEVRETFKISKVGTVAGCFVTDGFVKRQNQIRLIRDGIVTYTGDIGQLKRFKDDVNEVKSGYECGLSIKNFNDIKVGDIIEGFEIQEVKRTL